MTDFEAEWTRCADWLQAALDAAGNTYSLDDVLEFVARGDAVFWPGKQCAAVTEFIQFPRLKALNFWLLGGDLIELLTDLRPVIEDWARTNGCTRLIGEGRPGWQRALEPHGYTKFSTTMAKELT